MSTIQDRGYVWKKGTALIPSFTGFAVTNLLERFFTELVDYGFTAKMEDDLDKIAGREMERVPWLRQFYFGNGSPGLLELTSERIDQIDPREINSIPIGVDGNGQEIIVRVGRYGPYLQRGEERASVPEDLAPDEVTIEKAEELLAAPKGDRELGPDPDTGLPVLVKAGRFGPYVQLGEVDADSKVKPRTSSLFKTMTPETITLEDALQLLTLPRLVGYDPGDGEEIVALNGRYGPYLKKGSDSRSLESEDQLFAVTVDDAVARFAQPKPRRGQRSAEPLREVGADPATGAMIVIKEGRFGAYLTDGTVNRTVPRGETIEEITLERAAELLADKRAEDPKPKKKRGGTKAAAKKAGATAKKGTAKKAGAKKAGGAKKTAAKKAAPGD
jgi:DNA topoisomerase I